MSPAVEVTEVRLLEGPNLYFTRPAVKVSLRCPGYLTADEADLRRLAARLRLRGTRPGPPGSEQRQRFVMRLVAYVVRRLAGRVGSSRVGVRTRPGSTRADIVVAVPWRHRGRARAMGDGLGSVLAALAAGEEAGEHALATVEAAVAEAEPGDPPMAIRPTVPVASVTGTNGKTTTTRLLAHLGMTCGLRTGWSSTDGVLVQGRVIERGDYSGPAGARAVLTSPGVQLGILETARGGMLLKGMGVTHNDVSVVTNVTADHLGLHGVDTVDQLAEVKAIVTHVTKPTGWVVLNGEDPRVWAMRTAIRARPWAFALDPNSPALREALTVGGRGVTVLDGEIAVLTPGGDPDRLVPVLDVPVTLSGLSSHNVANALAATAAALGLGLPRDGVVAGLRTFAPDARHNPGRMNIYSLPLASGGTATVILDLAHNEAGLEALLTVAEGLRGPGTRLHLGLGTGGDRTDEILEALGELAGRRADQVSVVHKEHYLRGRTMDDLERHLLVGLARVGVGEVSSYPSELSGLKGMAATAADGDVLAAMVHADRPLLAAWLAEQGATADDAEAIRRKVVDARGEHRLEAEIDALWDLPDLSERIQVASSLLATAPDDPRLVYEVAGTLDVAGRCAEAIPLYAAALASGLREPHRHRALIQQASSLRSIGDPAGALAILDALSAQRPSSGSVAAFRALARYDTGATAAAMADALDALMAHSGDADDEIYRSVVHRQAAGLRR